jgi:hypothetical protein
MEATWRKIMRIFIAAFVVAVMVAVGAAAVLDNFVQQSSSAAFTEPGVRISWHDCGGSEECR